MTGQPDKTGQSRKTGLPGGTGPSLSRRSFLTHTAVAGNTVSPVIDVNVNDGAFSPTLKNPAARRRTTATPLKYRLLVRMGI